MNKNPFVLPGFGQSGQLGQNPILASMEMMRQAWEGLASAGGMESAQLNPMVSLEEMDKRISDLRAVENWLRMNLSMLSSTIQGLEVQRATVATLKTFVDNGMASMAQAGAQAGGKAGPPPTESTDSESRPRSPLEEALGMRPDAPQGSGRSRDEQAASGRSSADMGSNADAAEPSPAAAEPDIVGAAASAAQGWWNMLQQQFQTLAAATAATAEATAQSATESMARAARDTAEQVVTAAGGTASKSAAKKTTAKKTTAKKTSAKPAAARKAAAKKAPAKKTAAKKTTARKAGG